ncbi:hypothetical protein QBC35DRAFT_465064 [Podospora australis]|uniref:Galactose oxidase n=1 Tax=Podospora australis TaxID=1536484 RepID=A0AAN6WRD7_9PEZI|nr:hypothetical protein QBC35DRAFT_465064 [Podospora australis]
MKLLSLFLFGAPLAGVLASPCTPPGPTWSTLPPIALAPRQEHVAVALTPTSLAIFGGIVPAEDWWPTVPVLQIYDIPSQTWRRAADAPKGLNHPNAAVVNGKIFLLGGLKEVTPTDLAWRPTNESWVYDPATDIWSSLPPLPVTDVARGSAAMGVFGHIIFLAGGITQTPFDPALGEQESVDDVSAFDTKTNTWINLPAKAKKIPAARDHAGAAVVGNKFYILGGRDHGQNNVRDTVFELDFKNLQKGWVVKKGKMPTARGGVVAAAVGKNIYTIGGEGNPKNGTEGVFPQVEAYDTTKDKWEKLPDMQVPRHGTSAVALGGGIYIPGGGVKQGGAPVDVFDVFWP